MKKKKEEITSISKIFEPISNYLLGIETILTSEDEQTKYSYKLGVPLNWVLETNKVDCVVLGNTSTLKFVNLSPIDNEMNVDEFYSYVVDLIDKNVIIDNKRLELEKQINELKNKFQDEQYHLMKALYSEEDESEYGQEGDSTE